MEEDRSELFRWIRPAQEADFYILLKKTAGQRIKADKAGPPGKYQHRPGCHPLSRWRQAKIETTINEN